MAKWMALVFAAGWLIIGLAVIPYTTEATGKDWGQKLVGAFRNGAKTQGEWAKWRAECVAALGEKKSHCDRFAKTAEPLKCEWIPRAIFWLSTLESIPKETDPNKDFKPDCNKKLETHLLDMRIKDEQPEVWRKFINAYLKLYLDSCGLEDGFEKAIQNSEGPLSPYVDSRKYSTLYRFITKTPDPQRINLVVFYSRAIYQLDSTSKEIVCTDSNIEEYFDWLYPTQYGWHKDVEDLFAVYLDKCGFEEQFKKVIHNTELPDSKRWKSEFPQTLSSYFRSEQIQKKSDASWILSVVKELSKSVDISGEAYCTDEVMKDMVKSLTDSNQFPEFQSLREGYFEIYLEKCGFEQSFKEKVGVSEKLYSIISKSQSDSSHLIVLLSEIKKLFNSGSISRETDCTEELKTNWEEWLIAGGINRYLDEVLKENFALYLDKCGFEDQYKKLIDNTELPDHERWKPELPETLSSYFKPRVIWRKSDVTWILSVTEELSKSASSSKETYCTEEVMKNLVKMQTGVDMLPKFKPLVLGYFASYLQKCGLEQSFSDKLGNGQQDPVHLGRLCTFIGEGIWTSNERNWLLLVIMRLSNLESISSETICTKEYQTSLVEWLVESRDRFQNSNQVLKKYFAHYLVKCGFEERFKKAIDKLEQIPGSHSAEYTKTLFSFLVSEHWEQSELEWALSAIEGLSEFESVSKEADCTKELITKLSGMVSGSKDHFEKLYVILNEYQKFYKNLCGPNFEAVFE